MLQVQAGYSETRVLAVIAFFGFSGEERVRKTSGPRRN